MSLQKLIKYTDNCGLAPVNVDAVRSWFIDNNFQDEINFRPSPFDDNKLRGMIRKYTRRDGVYSDPIFVADILYASTLNPCWRNFVCTKEMMHIFDTKISATSTSESIGSLTANLTDPMLRLNPSFEATADNNAQLKALAVLAPSGAVDALRPSFEENRRSVYDIAKILMIPQFYIPLLFSKEFAAIRTYF